MATHGGKQPNAAGKERTRTTSPSTVPRQTRVLASSTQSKTNPSKLTSSSSTLSRNSKPCPGLNRGRSFDNKSSSNVPLQKSHSTITSRSTRTTTKSHVEKPLFKLQARSSSGNKKPGIGTVLNKKAGSSNVVVNRKVKAVDTVKAAPVIAEEIEEAVEENNDGLGLIATGDSDREDEQKGIREEEQEQVEEEEDEETNTHSQMGDEKEEQVNINEDDQIETSRNDDLPMDVEEQIEASDPPSMGLDEPVNIETSDHLPPMGLDEPIIIADPPMGEDEPINIADPPMGEDEPINIADPPMGEDEPINIETNVDPPMGEEEQIKIDDHDHQVEEDQVQDDPTKEKEDKNEREISPEKPQQQETEPEKEEKTQAQGGEKFLKATEIMKLMEAQTSGKDLTSGSPRQLIRGGSGSNRGSFNKKEVSAPAAAYNEVIEETASKLIAEKRKNKVLALAGAFETVISLQQD